jgi:hypothetical protein
MRSRPALQRLFATAFVAIYSCATHAQCHGVANGTGYKVLLDDVDFSTARGDQPVLSRDLLLTAVQNAVDNVRNKALQKLQSEDSVSVIPCTGWHPSSQAQINAAYIQAMAANHATLELWGTLYSLGPGQDEFDIHYVMFDVPSIPAPPPPSSFAYTKKLMGNHPEPQQITRFMADSNADLLVYFAVAAGVQAYQDKNWGQAASFLCEASTLLKSRPNQANLLNFTTLLSVQAGFKLRASSDPGGAAMMTDDQIRNYCTFATSR